MEDVRDRQYLIAMHKKAKKHGLDLLQYNSLRRKIVEVEEDLRRLRDPLYLHVPAQAKRIYAEDSVHNGSDTAAIGMRNDIGIKQHVKELMKRLKEKLTTK